MSENLPNIDDLFKKAIDQHEETPSASVWEAIDKNLDKKKVAFLSSSYNRLKWVAAALLLFSFGMAMYVWQTKMKDKELVNQSKINKSSKIDGPSINSHGNVNVQKPEVSAPESKESAENTIQNNNQNNKAETETTTDAKKNEEQLPSSKQLINNQENKGIVLHQVTPTKRGTNPTFDNGNVVVPSMRKENKTIYTDKEGDKNSATRSAENDKPITVEKQHSNVEAGANVSTERYLAEIPLISTSEWNDFFQIKGLPPFTYSPRLFPTDNTLAVATENKSSKKGSLKSNNNSSLSATVFFSPEFVGSDVKDDHPRFREDNRNEIKNSERVKSSSSYGILVDKLLGNKLMVGSGVYVITRVTDISPKKIFARPDERGNVNFRLNCSAGSAYIPLKSGATPTQGDSTTILSATNTLQYVSIPLSVKYVIGKGKLNVTPGVGIAINLLSKGKVESVIATAAGNESNTSNIEGIKSNYLNSQLSLGLEYRLSKGIALNFTPTARLALSSINRDAPVKTKLNSLGLAAGITIKL